MSRCGGLEMKRALLCFAFIFLMGGVFAGSNNPSSDWQANQPTFDDLYAGDLETYWPILADMKDGQCTATTDFVIGIPPGGCSPSVVRSDLLAEQNVPVFCQLYAIKVNPLIKVSAIKSISFKGDYPEGVRSIVYHPARAAIKSYSTLLGDATLENIGYVVIILKQQKDERNLTTEFFGNLTATMKYDAEEAYGTGRGDYYLEPMGDNEWNSNYMASSFWNGRGFLRVSDIGDGQAKVQVMGSKDKVLRTLTLKEGETSESSYLPGFYCKAGLKVKLTDITTQEDMALLNVDGQNIWVRDKSKFLDGKCSVKSLNIRGNNDGEISISCSGAGKIKLLSLRGDVVRLKEKGVEGEYNIGDRFDDKYIVTYGKLVKVSRSFVVLDSKMPNSGVVAEIEGLRQTSEDYDKFVAAVEKLKVTSSVKFITDKDDPEFVGMGVEVKDSITSEEASGVSIEPIKADEKKWSADDMYDLLTVEIEEGANGKMGEGYEIAIKKVLEFLLEEFGQPYYTGKVKFTIMEDWGERPRMSWEVDGREDATREVKIQDLHLIGTEQYMIVHELFHAFYEDKNFLNKNNLGAIEGLAVNADYKYSYRDSGDPVDMLEDALSASGSDAPIDLEWTEDSKYSIKEEEYMYLFFGMKFIKKSKSEIRAILGEGRVSSSAKSGSSTESNILDTEVDRYFKKSIVAVEKELVSDYGYEEKSNDETWAEDALYEEIVLARQLGKFATQKRLMDLFLKKYPLAKTVDYVRDMRAKMDRTDYSDSYASVYIGNEFKSISVVDFKPVAEGTETVNLKIGGIDKKDLVEMKKGEFDEDKNGVTLKDIGNIEVSTISPGKVRIYFRKDKDNSDKSIKSKGYLINEGESEMIAGIRVYVESVNVKEVAHVELIPDVKNDKSEANFTFRIEVEERAIVLSPDKTKNMLRNLNKSIEKWQDTIDRLGGVISGLKGACFATSAVLMIKSMASGTGGAALARSKIMDKYKVICDTDSKYRDMTKTECYNKLEPQIEADVVTMTAVLAGSNKVMKDVQKENTVDSGGIFGGESIKEMGKYNEDLRGKLGKEDIPVDLSTEETIDVPVKRLTTTSQIQAALTWKNAKETKNENVIAVAKKDMNNALRNVALMEKGKTAQASLEEEFVFGTGEAKIEFPVDVLTEGRSAFSDRGNKVMKAKLDGIVKNKEVLELPSSITDKIPVGAQIIHAGSSDYLYLFDGSLKQLGIYKVKRSGDQLEIIGERLNKINEGKGTSVSVISTGSCSNVWPSGSAKVSYYEAGDNKGLPAVVPFDLVNGWYVKVSNSGGTFADDSEQGYTASGDVKYSLICNIGKNRLMENGLGDDVCQSFNINSLGSVKSFGGCDINVDKLYSCARKAVQEASSQSGKSSVNIKACMNSDILVNKGEPASAIGGFECQNFMSASDCKFMFNVCDPVICPPSRCDLGGKMPVSDVIQTGVIGSLALCLPNAKEGIYMPICLSGVHAGLDTYLSILKSERSCLQHSLDTGELVGICDQITSIYKCEFFWRQMSPLLDQLIPGVVDYAVGGSTVRGGGEYAFVQQSYNTMKASVSYFKDTYAQNAFRAFNIRSTQEIGSSVCKAFVGTSAPGSANFLEDLLAPESPSQFYAQFSENLFTGATTPSTSQYKVYYHIYAGNDEGVQYKVYLKNPPASSYYASTPEVAVKSGYIAAGDTADESRDFTAPSGYKELCVVINAKTDCGFKSVTTDFGLDKLSKKYSKEQADKEGIVSEKECISGSPSALSMATLNIQSGLDEVANPDIALRGIVRVCASTNPDTGVAFSDYVTCESTGEGSDSEDTCGRGFKCEDSKCVDIADSGTIKTTGGRWRDVGYCGDASLRCWLDVNSVKDDLEALEAIDGASYRILDERRGFINNTNLNLEGVASVLGVAREDIEGLGDAELAEGDKSGGVIAGIIGELDRVTGTDKMAGAGTNGDRAEAWFLKASIWRTLSWNNLKKEDSKTSEPRISELGVNEEVDLEEEEEEGEEEDPGNGGEESEEVALTTGGLAFLMKFNEDCKCGYECENYADSIMTYSEENGVENPLKVLAVMIYGSECRYDEEDGERYGLMQITGELFEADCNGKLSTTDGFSQIRTNPSKVHQNIECGVKILKEQDANGEMDEDVESVLEELEAEAIGIGSKEDMRMGITLAIGDIVNGGQGGDYSDNKDFVDDLRDKRFLTAEEYEEINGEGIFNLEENMNFVKNVLEKRLEFFGGYADLSETTENQMTVERRINENIEELIESTPGFNEYCSIKGGGYFCAGYVSLAFNFIFGDGRNDLTGVIGDAWLFPENMKGRKGKEFYKYDENKREKFTLYDSLKVGDILGVRVQRSDYFERAAAAGQKFTHVVLYLGKIKGEHMVTHKVGEGTSTGPIGDLIEMIGESGRIDTILRPDQVNLKISVEDYIEANNIEFVDHLVVDGDDIFGLAAKYMEGHRQYAVLWMIKSRNNMKNNELFVGDVISLPKNKGAAIPIEKIAELEGENDVSKDKAKIAQIKFALNNGDSVSMTGMWLFDSSDKAVYIGDDMDDGKLTIEGQIKDKCSRNCGGIFVGYEMSETETSKGIIVIKAGADVANVGDGMNGGKIVITDGTVANVGYDMNGGEVMISGGEVDYIGEEMKGGSIVIKGGNVFGVGSRMSGGIIDVFKGVVVNGVPIDADNFDYVFSGIVYVEGGRGWGIRFLVDGGDLEEINAGDSYSSGEEDEEGDQESESIGIAEVPEEESQAELDIPELSEPVSKDSETIDEVKDPEEASGDVRDVEGMSDASKSIKSVKLDGVVKGDIDEFLLVVFKDVSFGEDLSFDVEHNCDRVEYRRERTGVFGSIVELGFGDINTDKDIGRLEAGEKYLYHLYCIGGEMLDVQVFTRGSSYIQEPDESSIGDKDVEKDISGYGKIAIVLDDGGHRSDDDEMVVTSMEFKLPFTFAVMPGCPNTKVTVNKIAEYDNFELILHQPMETTEGKSIIECRSDTVDKRGIYISMSSEEVASVFSENIKRLKGFLGSNDEKFVGMNNHMGGNPMQYEETMRVIGEVLGEGMIFLNSRASPESVAYDAIESQGVGIARRDVFIDTDGYDTFEELSKVEELALTKGYGIAIGHFKIDTVNKIKEFLDDNGYVYLESEKTYVNHGKKIRLSLLSELGIEKGEVIRDEKSVNERETENVDVVEVDAKDILAVLEANKNKMVSSERDNIGVWSESIYKYMNNYNIEKSPGNVAVILSILEQESDFDPDYTMNLSVECGNMKEKCAGVWPVRVCYSGKEQCEYIFGKSSGIVSGKEYALDILNAKNGQIKGGGFITKGAWGIIGPIIMNSIEVSMGPMRMKSFRVREILAEMQGADYEDIVLENAIVESIFTIDGSLKYGLKYLVGIFEVYGDDANAVDYVFADYNSGTFSSRNAELQYELFRLTRGEDPSDSFTDGDFLIWDAPHDSSSEKSNTQKMTEDYFNGKGYTNVREDLEKEKSIKFEDTYVFETIKRDYGSEAKVGRIPSGSSYTAKTGGEWSVGEYVRRAKLKHASYCISFTNIGKKGC